MPVSGKERAPVVAVANRLPVHQGPDGWQLSPGGLVTALRPVMEQGTGTWVGWDGGATGTPARLPAMTVDLQPVALSPEAVADYYHGFSNRTLWPLLHDVVEKPVYDRDWWRAYREVNTSFADAAVEALRALPGALLWVHDYHLMLVPELVRERLPEQRIGFFLHVPWPSPDLYVRLPWRAELLRGLLGADVVSFHIERYRRNFVQACRRLLTVDGVTVQAGEVVVPGGRSVRATASPISIDTGELSATARSTATDVELEALEE